MKNTILKEGDWVKYIRKNEHLDGLGFVFGVRYKIKRTAPYDLALFIENKTIRVNIVDILNEYTEYSHNFSKVSPDDLMRGNQ